MATKKSKPKPRKVSEKAFMKSLVAALRYRGVYVHRQNVIRGDFAGKFLSSGIPEGCSDLVAIFKPHGIVVWLECKSSTGILRDTQIRWRQEIEKLGSIYYVASPRIPLQQTLEELQSLVDKKYKEIVNNLSFKLE